MFRFNKAIAGTIGAGIGSIVAALFPDLGLDVTGAITTILTAALVYLAPKNAS